MPELVDCSIVLVIALSHAGSDPSEESNLGEVV